MLQWLRYRQRRKRNNKKSYVKVTMVTTSTGRSQYQAAIKIQKIQYKLRRDVAATSPAAMWNGKAKHSSEGVKASATNCVCLCECRQTNK
jgi:hypothetical protein